MAVNLKKNSVFRRYLTENPALRPVIWRYGWTRCFSIAITSLGEERANFSRFRTFVQFVLVWFCRFPLPLGVWEGLRFVIVALPGLFS